jgi:hypothetical protein
VVVVAWSSAAVASENVKAEARHARQQGKLLQVFLEACEPPMFFGERQGVDLVGWTGLADDRRFLTLAEAVEALIAGKRPSPGIGLAPKRRRLRLWEALGAAAAAAAIVSVFANIGGARDTLCSVAALKARCQTWGLMAASAPDAALAAAAARLKLVRSIDGIWGRQNSSCRDHLVTIAADARGMQIKVASEGGYASTGDVVTVDTDKRVIFTRDSAATADGPHAQWEYHPTGDQLTVIDKDGTPTTLVRCKAAPPA